MGIFTSCGHSQLTWSFLPCVDILTLCGHFHLMCMQDLFLRYGGMSAPQSEKSCCMGILTSHGHSPLMWTFSPHMGIFIWAFSPHMHTRLLLRYGWVSPVQSEKLPHIGIFTLHGHSHLTWAFSSCLGILTLCRYAHYTYILTCSLTYEKKFIKQLQFHQ